MLTNNQNIISNIQTHTAIADHDIVCDINVSPKIKHTPPRKIYRYDKADVTSLKSSLQEEAKAFLENNPEQCSVEDNWIKFQSIVNSHMEKYELHKMSKKVNSPILG